MSSDEIRNQKATLLIEHHEATQLLANLKEKALRMGRDIQQFGKWLADESGAENLCEQFGLPTDLTWSKWFRDNLLDEKYKAALDYEKAIALADEIREATAKWKDLEERKGRLGL